MLKTLCILAGVVVLVQGHGRLWNPPARTSAWRLGFDTPIDYNDNQLFCGGVGEQWEKNGGKCGVCGDSWSDQRPRNHEIGSRLMGNSITIVKNYTAGAVINVNVQITANHLGYFEFRLCVRDNHIDTPLTHECLNQHLLRHPTTGNTRRVIGNRIGSIDTTLQLPPNVSCRECVLQWKYVTANSWGKCPNGTRGLGCSPTPEQFYGCADISITHDGSPESRNNNSNNDNGNDDRNNRGGTSNNNGNNNNGNDNRNNGGAAGNNNDNNDNGNDNRNNTGKAGNNNDNNNNGNDNRNNTGKAGNNDNNNNGNDNRNNTGKAGKNNDNIGNDNRNNTGKAGNNNDNNDNGNDNGNNGGAAGNNNDNNENGNDNGNNRVAAGNNGGNDGVQDDIVRNNGLPTTTTQTPDDQSECRPADVYSEVPGMTEWCRRNCRVGFCPLTHCKATCGNNDNGNDNGNNRVAAGNNDGNNGVQDDVVRNNGPTTTTTQTPDEQSGCGPADVYSKVPGMTEWCLQNCRAGFCPLTHCKATCATR